MQNRFMLEMSAQFLLNPRIQSSEKRNFYTLKQSVLSLQLAVTELHIRGSDKTCSKMTSSREVRGFKLMGIT